MLKREQLLNLMQSIFRVREQEIPCSEFFELLPGYVDLVLRDEDPSKGGASRGKDPSPGLPEPARSQVAHHIVQCQECKEAYEALLQAARSTE